ncbi:hypothetical protein A5887_000686, partial [Enterococcus faecium]
MCIRDRKSTISPSKISTPFLSFSPVDCMRIYLSGD